MSAFALPRSASKGNLRSAGKPGPRPKLANAALVAFLFLSAFVLGLWVSGRQQETGSRRKAGLLGLRGGVDTLATYVFSNTDPEYYNNLLFFVEFAIRENDGCDYVLLVQTGPDLQPVQLPELPSNAKVVYHPNECYDWGSIGWVLFESGLVKLSNYKYFLIMNSSVRGPYLPPVVANVLPWHRLLTQRLNDQVKLVGPVISCEGSPFRGNTSAVWRTNPHVQSYVLATDHVGLKLLQQEGNVFGCWNSRWDAVYYAELGSSMAILQAGYNIDTLMTRYQGVDWRDKANWGCNGRKNPAGDLFYDGISLNPYEVLFMKVKAFQLQNQFSSAHIALKYEKWLRNAALGEQEILSNKFKTEPKRVQAVQTAYMQARGSKCFDFDLYRKQSPDLKNFNDAKAWRHFVHNGQFEGRMHRFTCDEYSPDYQPSGKQQKAAAVPAAADSSAAGAGSA